MTIFQLQCFITTAEYRNFSKAAERLYVSQPAITKAIRTLEDELHFPLFNRNSRSVVLTKAGESFLSDSRRIVKILQTGIEKARLITMQGQRILHIGTSMPENLSYLATLFRQFHEDYPDALINIKKVASEQLASMLETGMIDGAIDDLNSLAGYTALEYITIQTCPIVALVSRSNPLSGKRILSKDDICGQKIIIPSPASAAHVDEQYDAEFSLWLSSLNAAPFIHVESAEVMLSLVLANEGIAFPPSYMQSFQEEICQIPLDVDLKTTQVLAYRKDTSDPAMKLFVNSLTDYCSDLFL